MHIITIEACLELIAGLSETKITKPFIILDRDKKILIDIAKNNTDDTYYLQSKVMH